MAKTDVKKLPYTPVLDSLIAEVGLYNAAVFGRVWRYCQMGRGYCHAEQERIADNLGISRKTVNIALGELVAGGYLTDITPNTKGRTRIYKDTGKAGLSLYTDIDTELEPVTEVVTEPVTEVVTEVVTEPVTYGYTKIVKKEKKEKTSTAEVEVENSFFSSCNEEQKTAYQWVRKNANIDKSIEVAMRDNPLQAAYDYLDYLGRKGMRTAAIHSAEMAKILPEQEGKIDAVERELQKIINGEPTDADRAIAAEIKAERAARAAKIEAERAYKVYDPSKEPVKNYVPCPENLRRKTVTTDSQDWRAAKVAAMETLGGVPKNGRMLANDEGI